MDHKEESTHVWSTAVEHQSTTAQVHFVPDGGAVAQIMYSDDQDHPPQQVVYTADASSFTSVDASEHTLVYIHPVDGSQTLFTDQSQVAYVQQDATTQQVTVLLPASQSMNATNLAVLSGVHESAQTLPLEPVSQASLSVHDEGLPPMEGMDSSANIDSLQSPNAHSDAKDEDDDDEDDDDDDDDDSDLDEWDPDPPRPFDPNDLWCEECNNAHPSVCPKHGALHPIPNRPVLTRARASLPLVLCIDRFLGGVYSKRRIPKRTQFGPLEGPLVEKNELKDSYIHLKVSLDSNIDSEGVFQEDLWFELSEECLCNWMMFVRPAENHLEQNLVAYQYGQHIYYTTIKNVEPKQELKVWYAASYAEFVNQKIHYISQEEKKVLREQEKNWPCYECNRRFMSSEQLQQHLNCHDEKLDFFSRAKGRGRGRAKRKFGSGRRPGRPPKFMRLDIANELREKCAIGTQELLHFPIKGQFDDYGHSAPNGLDQSELSLGTALQGSLEQQPDSHLLQPVSHEQSTTITTQTSLTAEDMRRAKRIRNAALQHLFIRKSFRPFKCLQCGKAFREKEKLDQHLRFHGRGGNCPLTCDICNKGFLSSSSLDNHMKSHLEKTYSCIFCPESYDRLELLKEHVDVHVTDGYFSCPNCKKRFPDFIQVKKHVRSFHSEKIYQCTECDKAFCRPDKLRLHMLRHSDRKDFLCSTCGKQFKTKMVQHIRKKHPEFALLPSTVQAAVISTNPAVHTADSASGETVMTTDLLTQAMTELSQTLTTEYRTAQGDYQRIQYIPVSQATGGMQQPQHIQLQVVQVAQAPSPHQSQHSTVDMGQLHESQGYTQHAIQVQHIQVTEPTAANPAPSQVGTHPLSPSSQEAEQELSSSQMQTPTSQTQTNSTVQHAYLPSSWNHFRGYPSEIQMMTLPQGQYVIAEAPVGTPVTPVNSGQVKGVTQTHYVISEGQSDLELKKNTPLMGEVSPNPDLLEQPAANPSQTTQYIITTTTNMNGSSEVHISKP
ncbi:hypothetical protein FKM82_018261 [Ascaphus truei]